MIKQSVQKPENPLPISPSPHLPICLNDKSLPGHNIRALQQVMTTLLNSGSAIVLNKI
ncbi:hypothetical protein [Scytonema sp. NUACC21]